MVVVQRLTKGVEGQKGERNKTIILWAGGPYAFVGEPPPVIFFASHERNKMTEVLLRSAGKQADSRPESSQNLVSCERRRNSEAGAQDPAFVLPA